MKNSTEMLKGVLEGCVLEIISHEETYGYKIVQSLHSLGFIEIAEGTVYAILLRFEKNQWVKCVKKPSELGPQRKFYSLNENGFQELQVFWSKWNFISTTLQKLKEDHHG